MLNNVRNEREKSVLKTRTLVPIKRIISNASAFDIKVSIIVPIYNVQDYIVECLDSIINQTLEEIEIICVNDGSTDETIRILEQYAENDSRVVVVDKENAGYAHAMNLGIDIAKGKYIGIVESDDYVDLNMFADLYELAEEHNLDLVKGEFHRFVHDSSGQRVFSRMRFTGDKAYYNKVICPRDKVEIFDFIMHTWLGIYKREFLEKNNIRHNETPGASFQDTGFFFQTFSYAERIMLTKNPYYFYRNDRPGSSINNPNKVFVINNEYKFVENFLSNNLGFAAELTPMLQLLKYKSYLRTIKRIDEKYKLPFIKQFSKEFKESRNENKLKQTLFTKNDWEILNYIIDKPKSYYNNKVKELTVFMKFFKCWKENGFKYTIQRVRKYMERKPWDYRDDILSHIRILGMYLLKIFGLKFLSYRVRNFRKVKNKYRNERCFIVCTGPSLRIEDLDKIRGEYTIGVNSIFLSYDKTDWRPTFYLMLDKYLFDKMNKDYYMEFENFAHKEIFLNNRIDAKKSRKIKRFHLNFVNHTKRRIDTDNIKVSKDAEVSINDCFTVTNGAIELAAYMGFKDIYIIGADCNYSKCNVHFAPVKGDPVVAKKNRWPKNIERSIRGYKAVKKAMENKGIKIYNATRGGNLEVFDRIDFDTFLFKE